MAAASGVLTSRAEIWTRADKQRHVALFQKLRVGLCDLLSDPGHFLGIVQQGLQSSLDSSIIGDLHGLRFPSTNFWAL